MKKFEFKYFAILFMLFSTYLWLVISKTQLYKNCDLLIEYLNRLTYIKKFILNNLLSSLEKIFL